MTLSVTSCTSPAATTRIPPTTVSAFTSISWSEPEREVEPERLSLDLIAPSKYLEIPSWSAERFGHAQPRTTWRPEDQPSEPLRWDAVEFDEDGNPHPGEEHYTAYHGDGCCGACQTVALLGALLTQHRIDRRRPVKFQQGPPHRVVGDPHADELDIRSLVSPSRQTIIRGGRCIRRVAPTLAIVGAPLRADLHPLLGRGRNPWLPGPFCKAVMGHDLPVFRARLRYFDRRLMTVALRQGPVIIAAHFRGLERGDDGIFRCATHAPNLPRHHWMLIIGWELNDSDHDGIPDEVVWLARDDNHHRGGDEDTWSDAWLDDEWMRIVPRGCQLDNGRGYSVIPGSVMLGSFDNPTVPGPGGRLVSFCESDPDNDGLPTFRDLCPFTANPDQRDRDGDGIGDACDPCPDQVPTGRARFGHRDTDRDWIPDACDPCPEDESNRCDPVDN